MFLGKNFYYSPQACQGHGCCLLLLIGAGGDVLLVHNDGSYMGENAATALPVIAGTIVHTILPILLPDGCPPLVPIDAFPQPLLLAKVAMTKQWFKMMRGLKHEHIEGLIAEFSWRKRGGKLISAKINIREN